MNYETSVGCMRMMAELGQRGYLETAGVGPEDFKKIISDMPWMGVDRGRITQALSALMVGAADSQAIPRFNLPAEYIAAAVSLFVHPTNCIAACEYLGSAHDAESLGRQIRPGSPMPEKVTPQRIFALVCQLFRSDERSSARALFQKRAGLIMEQAKQTLTNKT